MSGQPGYGPSGDSFVWSFSGDTLSFHVYDWEDVKFNGSVGEEFLRLIKK